MTVGALYQIKNLNTNSANNFLDFNPQISFYKIVYRKHSRFAMENISFSNLSRSTLDYDDNVTIKCDVPRNGDLLRSLYFTFEIPDIYSGKQTTNGNASNYEFKWIKNLGINIFNSMILKINDQDIDKLYADYINIWKELTLSHEEKEIFNENIGHVKELYDPKNADGNSGNYPHITDQASVLLQADKFSDKNVELNGSNWIFSQTNIHESTTSNYDSHVFPSILGRKIKVPLPFFFASNTGLAVPLIALQYSVLSLEFNMKKFQDLYTIIDTLHSSSSNSYNKRIKPSSASHHSMDNFTNDYNYNINPNVEGEYIFLGDEERKRFAMYDHEYLIEQSRISNKDGVEIKTNSEETNTKIYSAFNPVKYLAWVVKRDDFKHINEWSNYTNWINPDIPPYSNQYLYTDKYYNLTGSKNVFYNSSDSNHKSFFNTVELRKNILTNVKIEFDGNLRIDKSAEYFSKQQIYQHFKKHAIDGIYVYSFSLNPLDYQPSGSCNFSDIYNPRIYFKKNVNDDSFSEYNYRAYVYIVSYNILVIKNGIGNLKFVN
jgi:hypothetical protein